MAAITKHLKGICEMERIVSDMERPEPMFQTWPAQLFCKFFSLSLSFCYTYWIFNELFLFSVVIL